MDAKKGSDMKKALFLAAMTLFGFCNPSYAERVVISFLAWTDDHKGTVEYQAAVIDHVLGVANFCTAAFQQTPPRLTAAFCRKVAYHSTLPAGPNVSSFRFPYTQALAATSPTFVVWEADQNTGAVQACILEIPPPSQPCVSVKIEQ
jgi:hypothetical protein